jgi:hypothetical protein
MLASTIEKANGKLEKAGDANGRRQEFYQEDVWLGLLTALDRLTANPEGLFTVPDGFVFRERRTVWRQMHELECTRVPSSPYRSGVSCLGPRSR